MNLGIDFGSTYTIMSQYDDTSEQLRDISLQEGAPFIPTVVAEGKGKLQFGAEAKNKAGKRGFATYKAFKMLLPEGDRERLASRGYDEEHSPEEMTRRFLEFCLQEGLHRCGGTIVDRLVIGVPEVWNDRIETLDGRNILRNICVDFPFVDQVQVVSEPAAASAFFAYNFRKNTGRDFAGHILLIDYGGGTLDITLTNVAAQSTGNVEIRIEARTGAGENEEGRIGSAGIQYMEQVMIRAIEESGYFPEGIEHDGRFYKAVDDLEEELKSSRKTIGDIFDEIGIDDPEELEEEEFTTIDYYGEEISVTYGLLLRVYNDEIEPVLREQLQKMITYMKQSGIRYDDADQEIFKIALVGGFGNFYLVDQQVRDTFRFSSMDKRTEDIINFAADREKAVSLGAALVASDIIRIRNTAPYSIGFLGSDEDPANADYAFCYKDDIVFDQPYYPHYKLDPEKPIAYYIGSTPNSFVVNHGTDSSTAMVVYLKEKYAKQLEEMIGFADEKYQTAVLGFSLDSSGILSVHIRPFNLFTKKPEGEDNRIVLDSFKNMFVFSKIKY